MSQQPDWPLSGRAARRVIAVTAPLVEALTERRTVLITGATGFIGSRLTQALSAAGHDVIALTRYPAAAGALCSPLKVITSLDQLPSDVRIDAVVNLAGEPIANGLWTRAKQRRILASRLRATAHLVRLIARLKTKPQVLVSGSAVGWYGLWRDEELTEFDGGKSCFTHRLCEAWEQTARRAQWCGVRVVRLRIGLVLGTEGGLLRRLLVPFRFGLGGRIGSGAQWMSWIARDDLVRLIAHAIATPSLTGAVNATAPEPVRNATFTRELARALARPAWLHVPAALLHHLAGRLADELLLGGQRVLPVKAEQSGFSFLYPTLADALAAMLDKHPAIPASAAALPPKEATPCLGDENPATSKAISAKSLAAKVARARLAGAGHR
jgi:uncharacterized protein (TIGR01777 family)